MKWIPSEITLGFYWYLVFSQTQQREILKQQWAEPVFFPSLQEWAPTTNHLQKKMLVSKLVLVIAVLRSSRTMTSFWKMLPLILLLKIIWITLKTTEFLLLDVLWSSLNIPWLTGKATFLSRDKTKIPSLTSTYPNYLSLV